MDTTVRNPGTNGPFRVIWCSYVECLAWIMLYYVFSRYTGWGISRLTPGWGISRLTPLYPTNSLSYAPGSQYTLYPKPLYTASQVRTTSRSWDKGVLTDLCLTRVLTDMPHPVFIIFTGTVLYVCGLSAVGDWLLPWSVYTPLKVGL